jgi:hypothetical protein
VEDLRLVQRRGGSGSSLLPRMKHFEQKPFEQKPFEQKRFEQKRFEQKRIEQKDFEQKRFVQKRFVQKRFVQKRFVQKRFVQKRFEQKHFGKALWDSAYKRDSRFALFTLFTQLATRFTHQEKKQEDSPIDINLYLR